MQQNNFILVNKTDSAIAEILLYGYIGSDDQVVASDFVKELRALEQDYTKINIRINSGGGSVYEGFAIFNAIRNSKAEVDTYIDGMAASMGTVIALAGKRCYMSKVAQFMTHRASGYGYGNADELRTVAQLLEQLEKSIAGIYAAKTGLTEAEAQAKYLATGKDKWMSSTEALAEKLIDGIYDSDFATTLVAPTNATEKEMWQSFGQSFYPKNSQQTDNTIFVL